MDIQQTETEQTDLDLAGPAVRKMVNAAADGSIPSISWQEEQGLRLSISPRLPSHDTCSSCRNKIPAFEKLGSTIASSLQYHLDRRRAAQGIVIRDLQKGATGLVEAPASATKWREVNVQAEWETAKPLVARRMVFPSEFTLAHVLLLPDHALVQGNIIPYFSLALQETVNALITREETLLSECRRNSVRAVTIRKNIESRAVDVYALGRPEKGWVFETIIGMVEFF